MTTGKGIIYIGIYVVSFRPISPCIITPFTMKLRDSARIHGNRIICQSYSGTDQENIFLCHNSLGKGITEMLCRSNPVAVLLLGSGDF